MTTIHSQARALAFGAALAALGPASAGAQAATDEAAVRARVPGEAACVEGAKADLTQWARLLAEAQRQLTAGTTPLARTEAAHSIVVLERRVRETAEALLECVAETAEETTVVREPEPTAAPLAPLAVHLRAGTPTPTGAGRIDAAAVHRSLLAYGREIDLCYEALAGRHAIVNGTAELVLRIGREGAILHVELRGLGIGDPAFQRCVAEARSAISSPGRPSGGEVTLAIPLHFGPEG